MDVSLSIQIVKSRSSRRQLTKNLPSSHFFRKKFWSAESTPGLFLALTALLSIVVANSALGEAYYQLISTKILFFSLQDWINEGLMVLFFFVIGMEVKKELVVGELRNPRKAALPISAALGGMLMPALIYLFFNFGLGTAKGWAIPTATDIAFGLGALTLLGKRVPVSLKVFLLTLAITDDLGAVLIIAIFYTQQIKLAGLGLSLMALLTIFLAQKAKASSLFIYSALGVALWVGIFYSGIHATIAGVILGLATPYRFTAKSGEERFPLSRVSEKIQTWVNFLVLPLFAFANAGIRFSNFTLTQILHDPTCLGVVLGLFVGKPLGVMFFSFATISLGIVKKPNHFRWRDLFGVSCLAGIGFTMAIFISNLSLDSVQMQPGKIAILAASLASAVCGYLILSLTLKPVDS